MSSPDRPDWWRGAVIYQVYPRSFQHAGEASAGVADAGQTDAYQPGVGNLAGITRRLDYLAGLGVDAVWLSPINTSPMKDFGYDVSNYRDIDPLFGSLDDFDALLKQAHALGLKVLIDQVLSHSSDEHPWFRESAASRTNPRADWYVWADPLPDGSPPNNWKSVFGGPAWTWVARRRQYYLHNFLPGQPDLNYHCPAVQDALLDVLRFWLDRGLDGFRLDTTNYFHHDRSLRSNPPLHDPWPAEAIPPNPYDMQRHVHDKNRPENAAFFERVRSLLNEYGATAIGEVGDAEALDLMIDYTAGGERLHMTYSFALLGREGHAAHVRRHVQSFQDAVADLPVVGAEGDTGCWPCWTVGNHDAMRVLSRWGGEARPADFTRMVMAMLFSLRGSACWYQGDEWSLPEADLALEDLVDPPGIAFWPDYKGRDGCRTPMPWDSSAQHAGFTAPQARPWLPVPPEHRARALDQQEADPTSALHFMRTFLAWRRDQPALRSGGVHYPLPTDCHDADPDPSHLETPYMGTARSDHPAVSSLVAPGVGLPSVLQDVLLVERQSAAIATAGDHLPPAASSAHPRIFCAFNFAPHARSVGLPAPWAGATPLAVPGLPAAQCGHFSVRADGTAPRLTLPPYGVLFCIPADPHTAPGAPPGATSRSSNPAPAA